MITRLLYVGKAAQKMARWYDPHVLMRFHFAQGQRVLLTGAALLLLSGCEVERRKSNAELGLNPQQASGRQVYDNYCDRCHAPYSSKSRQGPSLKHMFQKQYLPDSGLPANDDRVTDIIRMGRDKMPGFGQVLNQQQVDNLLAYLHTL